MFTGPAPTDQGYLSTPESRVDIIPVNSVGLNGSSSIRFTGPLDAVNNVVRDVAVAAQPSGSWLISVVLSDNVPVVLYHSPRILT
jgi:hypothetical protein